MTVTSKKIPGASFDQSELRLLINLTTRRKKTGKTVFHFKRIVAKRSVFNHVHIISSA